MPLEISERLHEVLEAEATLTLPFELRQKSRLLANLDDGREVRLFLPRGTVLRQDDLLRARNGLVVRVQAALEDLSGAHTEDPLRLARACYHLGNRHVPVQIGAGWVHYLHDHVLDNLVQALGLTVMRERAPFEPEVGAYAGHSHDH
ncbi:MAG: urease accessory protein UreE [Candidatus Competibacteraceae bacterium]